MVQHPQETAIFILVAIKTSNLTLQYKSQVDSLAINVGFPRLKAFV
jgi:hypothetical protein